MLTNIQNFSMSLRLFVTFALLLSGREAINVAANANGAAALKTADATPGADTAATPGSATTDAQGAATPDAAAQGAAAQGAAAPAASGAATNADGSAPASAGPLGFSYGQWGMFAVVFAGSCAAGFFALRASN